MSATPPFPESRSRVLEFQRWATRLVADEVQEIDEGWVVRTPSLSAVWWLNHVRVHVPLGYEEGVALCQRHPVGDGYHLYVDHEPSGQGLVERMRAEGWEIEVELYSVLGDGVPASGRPAPAEVIEPGVEEALSLLARWIREDETLKVTEKDVAELVESNRRRWPLVRTRGLGIRGQDGALLGVTLLFSGRAVAQVENVYVVPEARGRGYGRALVTHAAALAREEGHELTFIVADDNDWPKHLYADVGFQPVGRTWAFHRTVRD